MSDFPLSFLFRRLFVTYGAEIWLIQVFGQGEGPRGGHSTRFGVGRSQFDAQPRHLFFGFTRINSRSLRASVPQQQSRESNTCPVWPTVKA